jgi:5-methylcytosine-specific restriction protein A
MPRRALSPCTAPGCPNLTRTRRCGDHATSGDNRRDSAARRGYDNTHWRPKRDAQLRREPLCGHCRDNTGQLTPATQVDHIIPKAQGGTDHPENLQSLCAPCHSRKTQQERQR